MAGGEREPAPGGPPRPAGRAGTTVKRGDGDQRSRFLAAIVEVVAQDGYARAKIGDIAKRAEASRATFYELFDDKQACFLAAHEEHAHRLGSELEGALAGCESEGVSAARGAVMALVGFAGRERATFSFLTHDAILAGPAAAQERDRLITAFKEQVESAGQDPPAGAPRASLQVGDLLGGVIWVLNVRIRRGEENWAGLLGDLLAWIDLYEATDPTRQHGTHAADLAPVEAADRLAAAPLAPRPLPRGRHRLPAHVVTRVQRERILHATAQVMSTKGYEATTVADIVGEAGLSREVFYASVSDKREALIQAARLFFGQAMAVTAGAFFTTTGAWPDRAWEATRTLLGFLAAAPSFARLAFIECYAPDLAVARRTDDMLLGFSLFLEDGYRYSHRPGELSRTVSEAIIGTVVEAAAFRIRSGDPTALLELLPISAYVVLAPFTGVEFADDLVERKARELRRSRADAPGEDGQAQ